MKEIVEFDMGGKRTKGRLISENKMTAIVDLYRWINVNVVKIHKKKKRFVRTGEYI